MNVHNFESPDQSKVGCRLTAIFARQRELMEKYHAIEKENGLLQTGDIPVNLHDRFGQARLKDFAWRTTEELGEAFEALINSSHGDQTEDDHFREEMMDALHFLVELAILSDLKPGDIVNRIDSSVLNETSLDLLTALYSTVSTDDVVDGAYMAIFDVIFRLTLAMNCLKQKPWKQTHILTDTEKYRDYIAKAFHCFAVVLITANFTPEEVFDLYFRKSEVNKFRQRSQY